MLSKEEIQEFLVLLLAFSTTTKSSVRCLAALFDIAPGTAARWLRAARGKGGVDKLFYVRTDSIRRAILSMNLYDSKHQAYRRIASIDDVGQRSTALKALLLKTQ